MTKDAVLEQRIGEWRTYFSRQQAVRAGDIDELEDHLRSQVDALSHAGLDADEAFFVAVRRLGNLDSVAREYANEYSERLWKQLTIVPVGESPHTRGDARLGIGLAAGAAIALKIPELFGKHIAGSRDDMAFYMRNAAVMVLPFLAVFFARKRGLRGAGWLWLALTFFAGAVLANVHSFSLDAQTLHLTIIHLPIALWLGVGFAYAGGVWRAHEQRMNFVRFSGEWFIYYTLIALGGGTLTAFTVFIFNAIGLTAESVVQQWIVPCGAAGAVVIGAWLVEFKKSVVENMAPVLTVLFTPLFTVLLLVFVGTMIWTRNPINMQRDVLIGFDLLLVLVLALSLYAISARDGEAAAGRFDVLQLLLVVCALVVDVMALWAMLARISEFGFSPNKTAALGMNILLLVNLAGSAILYARFLAKRTSFAALERWQTTYLPAYGAWAWIVVAFFPVIFNYQ